MNELEQQAMSQRKRTPRDAFRHGYLEQWQPSLAWLQYYNESNSTDAGACHEAYRIGKALSAQHHADYQAKAETFSNG